MGLFTRKPQDSDAAEDGDEYEEVTRTIINGRNGQIEAEYSLPRYVVKEPAIWEKYAEGSDQTIKERR
jgi:hypothetical protein